MSYTIPTTVQTKAEAVLAVASAIADEDMGARYDGTVNTSLDVLADVLAAQDVDVPQTNAGAILALAQYAHGGGGGATTDVYLWNMKGEVVPSKVEYVSGYSGGTPTYTQLEIEGTTNEFNGGTVYGIKVKDCPAGGNLKYTLPSGYDFDTEGRPAIGYSAVLFPAMPGTSSCAMIPIEGMYQVSPFVVITTS